MARRPLDAGQPLRVLSLCAGVGGLDLAVDLAVPTRTACYVEIEAFAAACLAARMEEGALGAAPVWSDLTTFDGRAWRGAVDLVLGGYPCQPFSVVGKRQGTDDPRHLWPHVARVIREVEAPLVFLENVPGHLRLGLDLVAGELRSLGYTVAADLFTAEECGAPHKRERLFILAARVGDAAGQGLAQRGGLGEDRAEGHPPAVGTGRDVGEGALAHGDGGGLALVGTEHDDDGSDARRHVSDGCRAGLPGPFPPGPEAVDEWTALLSTHPHFVPAPEPAAEPGLHGVADGTGRTRVDRIRALGNGVVPVVAAYAFVALACALGAAVAAEEV